MTETDERPPLMPLDEEIAQYLAAVGPGGSRACLLLDQLYTQHQILKKRCHDLNALTNLLLNEPPVVEP